MWKPLKQRYLLLAALLVGVSVSGILARHGQAANEPRVYTALGVASVQGERAFVHVAVAVGAGQDVPTQLKAALGEQGARPATPRDLQSDEYSTTGLVWDQFSDGIGGNDSVLQNYNPSGDGTSGNGDAALLATHATWTDVATSKFAFSYGGTTNRCPSLVKECPGDQVFDGNNDVGWLGLQCNIFRCTLGVTWYSTSIDEADMALNTNVGWHAGCTNVSGQYDAQTVMAHENGHVAGLGHSSVQQALMYAYYTGAHCQLHQDDIDGISFLYPEAGGPEEPTATPTDTPTPTNTPDPNAPTVTPTPTPTPNCPPGHGRRGLC